MSIDAARSATAPDLSGPRGGPSPWIAALALVGALTVARLVVLFVSPLELYPDEAQYWLWSRHLAFGYYSKPPMVAWLIGLTTGLGGNGEPWVRIGALVLNGLTPLVLFQVARRLFDARAGFWTATVFSLMPGIQLSSGVITTDSPLLFFLSLALWAYVAWIQAPPGTGRRLALATGLAVGGAFLSKYAAIYFLIGLLLHAALSPEARRRWSLADAGLMALGLGAALAPNLIWNAAHGFATVSHTASNANWRFGHWPDFGSALGFAASQFGVFGPIPCALLLFAAWYGWRTRRDAYPERRGNRLLLCMALPPLILVLLQAFLSRANANWAAAGFVAGSVLAGGWLSRTSWPLKAGTWTLQLPVVVVFLACAASPTVADGLGVSNSFKRARGWAESSRRIVAATEAERARGWAPTAIAVDDRFLFNTFSYYARDWLARPTAPPLKAWVRQARPHNQAETTDPLTVSVGDRVLFASIVPIYRDDIRADFARPGAFVASSVALDRKRRRDLAIGRFEHFQPRPASLRPTS